MKLPDKFKWLLTIGTLPKMITAGLEHLGVKEIPGKESHPVIISMAIELGVRGIYTNDDTSWCALFQSYICKITGKPMPFKSYKILRAKSFASWGNPVVRGEERLGDILVFKRPGGHHVGMYIAESNISFFVLGGNQSNAVSITEIKKERLMACRRYYAIAAPASVKKYIQDSTGKFSTNES